MKKLYSNKILVGTFVLIFFLAPDFVQADAGAGAGPANLADRFDRLEARISELQNQLTEQNRKHQEEIETLKRQVEIKVPEEKAVYLPGTPEKGPKWLEGLSMGGDIRLRYDAFEQNEATRERNRFRYRVRWKVAKQVTENLELAFRLVNGATTDPTSTNQTMTGDFTYKNFLMDQAYVKYKPEFLKEYLPSLETASVVGGKFENPFLARSSTMVWDGDVMPEGFAETFEFSYLDGKLRPFVTLGQYLLQENASAPDAEIYGVQTGAEWAVPGFSGDSAPKMTSALAYYDFSDYARNSNFITDSTSLARGNTRIGSSTSLEAGDFDIFQVYNALQFKMGEIPVKVFSDFAVNLADQTEDPLNRNNAYEYGLKLGGAKKKGDWEATYYYAYIEPNAVVGAFSESDFGAGHADKRGSALSFKYALTDYLKFGFTAYFVNNVTGIDDETRRFLTDLEWVF